MGDIREQAVLDPGRYYESIRMLGINSLKSVRDLWRQQDLSTSETNYFIPSHGVKYLKVRY